MSLQFTGVYTANFQAQSVSLADDPLIELTVPTNTSIYLLRAWIGLEGAVADQMQEVEIYRSASTGTGGTALTEHPHHVGYAASSVIAFRNRTAQGASPVILYPDGFHIQQGWLYQPIPEEFITAVGGSTGDVLGVSFPVAPDAAITLSAGMTWGEVAV